MRATAPLTDDLPRWRCPAWTGLPGVEHFVSERSGGRSRGRYAGLNLGLHVGDDPAAVLANRAALAAAVGSPPDRFVFADQVHGNRVAVVNAADAGRGTRDVASAFATTDALITDVPDLWLAVLVADCVPLLLADPVRGAVAVAHAGWRGTASGVAGATVEAMAAAFGSRPADLRTIIGPSVGPGDYEVDEPVIQAFRLAFPEQWRPLLHVTRPGHALLDLWAANRLQLTAKGIPDDQIAVAGLSTARATDRFFSVRGEGSVTGRFGAFVRLTGP